MRPRKLGWKLIVNWSACAVMRAFEVKSPMPWIECLAIFLTSVSLMFCVTCQGYRLRVYACPLLCFTVDFFTLPYYTHRRLFTQCPQDYPRHGATRAGRMVLRVQSQNERYAIPAHKDSACCGPSQLKCRHSPISQGGMGKEICHHSGDNDPLSIIDAAVHPHASLQASSLFSQAAGHPLEGKL